MYTDTEAQLFINGKTGPRFKVTRGVAQGCVLSPIFFDIYMDDLLQKFRDEKLGVPVGQLIQGPSSFADDLALIAPNKNMAMEYLRILDTWCSENFFKVNPKKSGILRIGPLREQQDPNLQFQQERIRLLDEKDPILENVERFKYLGFLIPEGGSWDDFTNQRLLKCKQALGQYWRFFKLANISADIKFRAAQTLIFSHLAYGEEIICLTRQQAKKLDAAQAKVIKTILQLPIHSSTDATRFITGQMSLSATHNTRCLTNLQRIRNLPNNTQLKKIYNDGAWHQKPFTFADYATIERNTISHLKYSNTKQDVFNTIMKEPPSKQGKKSIKDIYMSSEQANLRHRLRLRHPELVQGFEFTRSHPMWKISPSKISSYIKWITGASRALADPHNYNMDHDTSCRLCDSDAKETREHLLSHCDGTSIERVRFYITLEEISVEKLSEFEILPEHSKWIWILAGGIIRSTKQLDTNRNKIIPTRSPLKQGKCVNPVKDKDDPGQCLEAYYEYQAILHSLEKQHIRVYTDGSRSTKTGLAGFGFQILFQDDKKTYKINWHDEGIGKASIQHAELSAIRESLRWLGDDYAGPVRNIHIFTDSKYAYNTTTSSNLRRTHYYLIQEIQY